MKLSRHRSKGRTSTPAASSSATRVKLEAWRPAFGDAGPSLVDLARRSAPTVMIIANGSLHRPEQAEAMLKNGADLIALGRGALANQDWPLRARNRRELAPFDAALLAPFGDLKPCEITPGT